MKQYTGRVEKIFDHTVLHTNDGQMLILRRTGKDGIRRSKMLSKLDGRRLVFDGRKMGKFLFISKWMTPGYLATRYF